MIRTEMTLTAGFRQTCDRDRRRVPCVARRARTDRAVVVRLSDAVALRAAARRRRRPFERRQRMRRPPRSAGLIALREFDLLRLQARLTVDRGPRRRGMAAAKKLLINRLVAAAAVARRQLGRDDESVVLCFLLALGRLMAVETVDALLRVPAHLELVHHRVLLLRVALGALSGRTRERCRRLIALDGRPGAVDEKRADDQGERDDDGDEDGAE